MQLRTETLSIDRALARVEFDEPARWTPKGTEWNHLICMVLDSAEEAASLRLIRRPTRLQNTRMGCIGNVTALHELLALRAMRMNVSHV